MKTKAVSRRLEMDVAGATSLPVEVLVQTVTVTVIFAQRDSVWHTGVTVPDGADIATVLRRSGFAQLFPDYPLETVAVGVFGRRCRLDEKVKQGDRIEIYRPLQFDPMESRRRRAAHRKTAKHQSEFRPRRVRVVDNS